MRHVKQCRDGRLVVIVLTPGTMKPHTAVAVSCVTVEATRAARGRPGSPGRHLSEIDCASLCRLSPPVGGGGTAYAGRGVRYSSGVCLNSYFPNYVEIQFRYNSYTAITRVRDKIQCSMLTPCIGSMHVQS